MSTTQTQTQITAPLNARAKRGRGRPRKVQTPPWRKHVSVPGILFPSVRQRWAECFYRTFSPYAVELVCFDLRKRHAHDISHMIWSELAAVQDAIDRRIVSHYRPGTPRDYGLINRLLQRDPEVMSAPVVPIPSMAAEREHIYFPSRLRPYIEERWRELGYDGVSAYVTGVIRYDLALGGPHTHFTGADMDPARLEELDRLTEEAFRANRGERIRLDYMVEEVVGRTLTAEERAAEIKELTRRLKAAAATGK